MKIVISGGTGFIGHPLASRLAHEGHSVTVLSRSERGGWHPNIEVRQTTPAAPIPGEVLAGMEAFIHLAAEPLAGRWNPARMARIRESRAEGTARFMRQAQRAPRLRVVLNASGVGFYGPRALGEEVNEEAPRGDGFLAEVTAAREQGAELLRTSNRRVVQLRIGLVLHPSGGYLAQLEQLARKGFSGQVGAGSQGVSWIHRHDLLRLFEHALHDARLDGPVNACAPEKLTNGDLVRAVAARSGRRRSPMPGWVAKLMLGELGATLLRGQHVVPARARQTGFDFLYPHLADALADLYGAGAHAPVPPDEEPIVDEGLRRMVR